MPKNNKNTVPLHGGAFKPKVIAQVDQKKGGVNTVIMNDYKCEKNDVPVSSANGSTVPLMEAARKDEELGDYDPFQHRNVDKPTSDMDTLIHLLKGSLGSGILAMPAAFANAGLFFGLFCILAIGVICTYCVHILVKSAHELCRRTRVPSLSFDGVAEAAFLAGPKPFHQWARFAKAMVNFFLVVDLLGCCCVYVLFVSENIKQTVDGLFKYMNATDGLNVTDQHSSSSESSSMSLTLYMVALLPFLILINLIRNLKLLAPLSMIANLLVATGMGITFYYIFSDFKPLTSVPAIVSITHLPKFFGTAIFALEGIGVIMPLENNMKTPHHFIGCPGVLNFGMTGVVILYSATGFFGYLVYSENVKPSITLNLPNEPLGMSVKLMIAVAIFFTYALQFYVPMEIIWRSVRGKFRTRKLLAEYTIRIALVTLTVVLAILIPNLGAFISLVGALCLSMLGLIFPAIIELITFYEDPGLGRFNWRLWKNMFLIVFGLIGFVTGSYVSINEIVSYNPQKS